MIYRLVFKLVLVRLHEETAHRIASLFLRALAWFPPTRIALRLLLSPRDGALKVDALGMTFPSPLGLAAGVDTNGSWFKALGLLGFGFVEVGTVTAKAQEGNAGRRVFRLLDEQAILNRRGFPNDGASAMAARLSGRPRSPILGVNVGKSRSSSLERAGDDYRLSVRRLAALADYIVLNVSSPNTPGLRELQAVEPLRELIEEVRAELRDLARDIPLLVKIAPDMSDVDLDAIADLALSHRLDGIVAVNTTVDRTVLRDASPIPADMKDGGISGAPLRPRALQVLRRLHRRTEGKLVLISVGGVQSSDDVWQRVLAGATLVQAHTGFVYGGPLWPHDVNRALARRVREAGLASIGQAVGRGSVHGEHEGSVETRADSATPQRGNPVTSRPSAQT